MGAAHILLSNVLASSIGSPKRYYFEDVGLHNARPGFRQAEQTHIMENIDYNELRARGFSVDVGCVEKRSRVEGELRDDKRAYVNSVIQEIFKKDVRRRVKIRNVSVFNTVRDYVNNNFGATTSLSNILSDLKSKQDAQVDRETLGRQFSRAQRGLAGRTAGGPQLQLAHHDLYRACISLLNTACAAVFSVLPFYRGAWSHNSQLSYGWPDDKGAHGAGLLWRLVDEVDLGGACRDATSLSPLATTRCWKLLSVAPFADLSHLQPGALVLCLELALRQQTIAFVYVYALLNN